MEKGGGREGGMKGEEGGWDGEVRREEGGWVGGMEEGEGRVGWRREEVGRG